MKPECCCVSQRDCLDIIARRRSGTSAGRVLPADSARHLLALLRTPLGPFPACSPGHSGQAPGPSAPSSRSRRSRQRVAPPPQGGRPCIVAIRPTRPMPRCDPWPPAPPRSDAPRCDSRIAANQAGHVPWMRGGRTGTYEPLFIPCSAQPPRQSSLGLERGVGCLASESKQAPPADISRHPSRNACSRVLPAVGPLGRFLLPTWGSQTLRSTPTVLPTASVLHYHYSIE